MSEQSRRAQKKALTRAHVRETAQRLFAEHGFDTVTIADVAATADVAVQTVFNHFATKEELYWSGRAPWVSAPEAAVRERPAGVPALRALREHLAGAIGDHVEGLATPEGRRVVSVLGSSPGLQAAERELVHECEGRVRAALLEAWTGPGAESPRPVRPAVTAGLVAATWVATTRVLATGPRDPLPAPEDVPALAAAARELAARLLTRFEVDVTEQFVTGEDPVRPGALRAC
ncbi:AcrR family transcriptional regulator [Geodermatophilus bullaregiensis]|uniref:TetR/AcrR family transcriptional regulator n=1 Tax=Geodermatophilus bullaregiensis TaxID=1564160 RepID=UPI00195882C2|nr:TetR/AcrR family transcriptional regulator [Geodermatophilus bullaregiensis]MBM7806946.1 AcrR family transcriptional regulator [Geodermatophilus bullaregiensis]